MTKIADIGMVFILTMISLLGAPIKATETVLPDVPVAPAVEFMLEQVQEQDDSIFLKLDIANSKLQKFLTKKDNHVNINYHSGH